MSESIANAFLAGFNKNEIPKNVREAFETSPYGKETHVVYNTYNMEVELITKFLRVASIYLESFGGTRHIHEGYYMTDDRKICKVSY